MKIVDRFIRFGLIAMIALSLYLSWKIWTNSGNQEVAKSNSTSEVSQSLRQANDVFLPTHLIYHDKEDKYQYTNRESLLTNLTKEIVALEFGEVTGFTLKKDKDVFIENQDTVELLMSAPLDLNYFFEINGKKVPEKNTVGKCFNRIVLSFKDKALYFLDDEELTGFQLDLKGSVKKANTLLQAEDNRYTEVSHKPSDLSINFYFEEELRLKTYSYILGMQSYTVFSQAFFDSNEEVISNDDSDSKDVSLLSDNGSSLKASYDNGEVSYSGRFDQRMNDPLVKHNLFSDSYYYVQKLANAMGTIRYFDSNQERIVYRNFVEGFPIFSDHKKGRVELKIVGQNIQIETNQETIQVPIPSEEEVILKKTEDALGDLAGAGLDLKKVEDFKVGYTWTVNEETKQAIDLVPEWYVKTEGVWDSSQNVINQLRERPVSSDGF